MTKFLFITLFIAGISIMGLILASPTTATPGQDWGYFGKLVAGTMFSEIQVTEVNGVPTPGLPVVYDVTSFGPDGGAQSTDTTDAGGHPLSNGLDSPRQGEWRRSGQLEITIDQLGHTFDLNGVHTGYSRLNAVLTFSNRFSIVSGTFTLDAYTTAQDPLVDPPVGGIAGTIDGRRL